MSEARRDGGPRAVFFVCVALVATLAGLSIGFALSDTPAAPATHRDGYRAVRFAESVTPPASTGRNFLSASTDVLNQTSGTPRAATATATLSAAARTAVAGNSGIGVSAITANAATTTPVRAANTATRPASAATATAVRATNTATPNAARAATAVPSTAVPSTATRAANTSTAVSAAPTATMTTGGPGNAGSLTGGTPAAASAANAASAVAPTSAPTVRPTSTLPPTAVPITDASGIYAKVSPAVVTISNPSQRQPRSHAAGLASGIVYDPQGYIVTVGRVLVGGQNGALVKQVDVIFANERKVQGTVIGRDLVTDLAVVKIDPAAVPGVAPFGDSAGLRVGQAVVAIGNPMEFNSSITRGVISGINRPVGERSGLIQTSAATSSGAHGGPLVDGNGNVVGVLTLNIHDAAAIRLGFAVPGANAKSVTAALVSGGVSRPSLGATVEMLSPVRAASLSLGTREGAYVSSVVKGGAAEKGGLLPGDVITAVNGTPVTNAAPLTDAMRPLAPKQSVILTVNRKGTTQTITVTLGETT